MPPRRLSSTRCRRLRRRGREVPLRVRQRHIVRHVEVGTIESSARHRFVQVPDPAEVGARSPGGERRRDLFFPRCPVHGVEERLEHAQLQAVVLERELDLRNDARCRAIGRRVDVLYVRALLHRALVHP